MRQLVITHQRITTIAPLTLKTERQLPENADRIYIRSDFIVGQQVHSVPGPNVLRQVITDHVFVATGGAHQRRVFPVVTQVVMNAPRLIDLERALWTIPSLYQTTWSALK